MDTQIFARNMERYFELNKIPSSAYETRDNLIEHLVRVAHEKRKVLVSNNAVIEENIVPYEKGATSPAEDELNDLSDFFKSLYVNGVFYDRGTSERIIHVLYDTYVKEKKYDNAARQLQFIYYFDIINNSHQALGNTMFSEGLAETWTEYFDELSERGRLAFISFLLATVYNETDKKNALKRMDLAVQFINQIGVDINDKSNQQAYCAYRSSLVDLLGHVCDALDNDINAYTPEEMERINVYRQQFLHENDIGNLSMLPFSTDALVKRLQYYFGECTQEELLEWLLEYSKEQFGIGESKALVNALGAESNYFSTIQYNFKGTQNEKKELWQKALKDIVPSFKIVEKRKDDFYVFDSSAQLVQMIASQVGFEVARKYVFDMTVFHDKALSIHTIMVSDIAQIILEELLKVEPEFLEGVCGYSLDFIKNNHDEVLKLMRECALFHDIGKHYCLDYVQIAYRNLTDREFSMIKCHSEDFEKFFPEKEDDSEELKCIRDCAVLHHTWHDGTKGYPIRKHTYNRPFVDVLSIADSIDAATDSIGRPYNKGKTLDALIEEFEGFADTRYSATVVSILKMPNVKEQIEQLIDEGRKNITYAAYTDKLKI